MHGARRDNPAARHAPVRPSSLSPDLAFACHLTGYSPYTQRLFSACQLHNERDEQINRTAAVLTGMLAIAHQFPT